MAENEAGEVRGFALWFLNYSTWEGVHGIYLEDLYVRPEARGEGHGKALLQHLAATAVDRGYARVEWSVLDWNEPSINFYKKLGAAPMEEWSTFRLTGDALEAFGAAHRSTPVADLPAAGAPWLTFRGRKRCRRRCWRPRRRPSRTPSRRGTNTAGCAPRSTTSRCRWTTSAADAGRRDHHRLCPRIRLHGPQRGGGRRSCRGCSTCRAARAGAATASRRSAAGARPPPRTSAS